MSRGLLGRGLQMLWAGLSVLRKHQVPYHLRHIELSALPLGCCTLVRVLWSQVL